MRPSEFAYKQDHPYEKRNAEALRIREKYPDRIPVICEKDPRSDIPPVDKRKYGTAMGLLVFVRAFFWYGGASLPEARARCVAALSFANHPLAPIPFSRSIPPPDSHILSACVRRF